MTPDNVKFKTGHLLTCLHGKVKENSILDGVEMGQHESRSFANDGILQIHYGRFNSHREQIELGLKKSTYYPYSMKGIARAAALIASHPDDRNGNPAVLSTAELLNAYATSGENFSDFSQPTQEKLFESQQLIYDSYVEIIIARHHKESAT